MYLSISIRNRVLGSSHLKIFSLNFVFFPLLLSHLIPSYFSLSIVHRDIKPNNIFVLESSQLSTESNRLVLGDFGLSKSLQSDLFTNSICYDPDFANSKSSFKNQRTFGSLGWMAPEMCNSTSESLVSPFFNSYLSNY